MTVPGNGFWLVVPAEPRRHLHAGGGQRAVWVDGPTTDPPFWSTRGAMDWGTMTSRRGRTDVPCRNAAQMERRTGQRARRTRGTHGSRRGRGSVHPTLPSWWSPPTGDEAPHGAGRTDRRGLCLVGHGRSSLRSPGLRRCGHPRRPRGGARPRMAPAPPTTGHRIGRRPANGRHGPSLRDRFDRARIGPAFRCPLVASPRRGGGRGSSRSGPRWAVVDRAHPEHGGGSCPRPTPGPLPPLLRLVGHRGRSGGPGPAPGGPSGGLRWSAPQSGWG